MVGLISAVEGQLRLSHSPEPAQDPIAASDDQATAAATDSISKGRSDDNRVADAVATQLVLAGHSDSQLPQQSGRDLADDSQGCLGTPGQLQEGGQAPVAAAAPAAEQASKQEATSADAGAVAEEAAGLLALTVHAGHQVGLAVMLCNLTMYEFVIILFLISLIWSIRHFFCTPCAATWRASAALRAKRLALLCCCDLTLTFITMLAQQMWTMCALVQASC